jgi:hypothetical protein
MKSTLNIILIGIAFFYSVHITQAQTKLTLSGNQVKQTGGYIVLKNASLVNNSTFQSSGGTVLITGDAADANSTIDGTSTTTFNNLTINKSSNNVMLENGTVVTNTLTLTSGNLDLQENNLTVSSGGSISGGSSSSYIKTSGTGVLIREVGATNVVFPVGKASYTPITLNNSGTTDNFLVRVENIVYKDGTSGNEVTTDVVDVSWHVDEEVAGNSDLSMTVQWNSSDELTDFDRTNAFLSHYTGGAWNYYATQAAVGSDPYTITQANITDFSVFTLASNSAALPVELLYFYAEKQDENVRLDWQTANELNNAHFDVEWSTDGHSFEKIGQVEGAGTSNDINFYDFLHITPALGLNYYRLKQVDFDGKFEYTNIIQVNFEETNFASIKVYPNPATDYITIDGMQLGEVVQIFSVNGQLMKEINPTASSMQYIVSDLASGTYFVKVGEQVKKFIIQK